MAEESYYKSRVIALAKGAGWLHRRIEGGSQNGWPDDIFLKRGRHVWIEFKAEGEKPRPQQFNRIKELHEHGAEVHWVDNPEAALTILGVAGVIRPYRGRRPRREGLALLSGDGD